MNPLFRAWSLAILAGSLAALGAEPARAGDPQPAKKDSRAAVRPKEATFTTAVVPSKAKPGDVVTFQVRARVDAPWHIYKYSKGPGGDGPKPTTFDFFDPAGLAPEGDWTADPAATKKAEPAFPDIPFVEFHEDEVVWSRKLKVPADAKPGPRTLKCQIGYMLCSDQNCSFPGQWTLPAATVTVVAAGSPSSRLEGGKPRARLISAVADDPAPAADGPKPAVADSRPRIFPKTIKFTTEFAPSEAKPGDTVQLKLTAHLDPGYHIFQYAKKPVDNGPRPLQIDGYDLGGLVPQGDWTASRAPTRKHDPNFPAIEALEFFEDEVTWSLPLQIPAGAAPGAKPVRVQAGFQVCSASNCSIPGQWTMPTATLAIAGGTGATAPAAAPPAVAEVKPPSAPTPPADASPATVTRAEAPAPNSSAATTADVKASKAATVSEIERTAQSGMVPFLLACAGAGLLALAMPCVWPMIPVTVNFFVKQGEKGGSTTGLAFTYCLAIIGIFTGIGVLFSAILGGSSLSNLANNPWLNATIAALFFAFGLSLLGLFEIRLPGFLLNASAQGEGRGGLVGVVFMASTLSITSFTCTFPVVGGLLIVASRGSYLYPIIGLATFAAVVAVPFLLLALAPGLLKKMPKSGDWMNSVKVVGGLVELAAAFKFVNTAEIGFHSVPEAAWVDEQTLLTVWVVIAAVCGLYLLGLFRTDHDHADAGVGPGRMVFGSGFLFIALYLAPVLFGQTPHGMIWDQIFVGMMPPKGSETKATSSDPVIALTQEKSKHGVLWGMSYEAALDEAKKSGKRVLIDFTGVNCSNCRQMERTVMPLPAVAEKMGQFVTVQLYTDFVPIATISQAQREELAAKNIDREIDLTGEATNPFYVVLDPATEKPVAQIGGYNDPATFLNFLEKGLTGSPAAATAKVADRN